MSMEAWRQLSAKDGVNADFALRQGWRVVGQCRAEKCSCIFCIHYIHVTQQLPRSKNLPLLPTSSPSIPHTLFDLQIGNCWKTQELALDRNACVSIDQQFGRTQLAALGIAAQNQFRFADDTRKPRSRVTGERNRYRALTPF